jgi:hypothetical protein
MAPRKEPETKNTFGKAVVGSPFFFRFTTFPDDPLEFDYEEYFMRRNVGEMPNHIEFPNKEMEQNFEILFTWHL